MIRITRSTLRVVLVVFACFFSSAEGQSAGSSVSCVGSAQLQGEPSYQVGLKLLLDKKWPQAAQSMENVLANFEAPAAALYAAYAHAKAAHYESCSQLVAIARNKSVCLTQMEKDQLDWLVREVGSAREVQSNWVRVQAILSSRSRGAQREFVTRNYQQSMERCEEIRTKEKPKSKFRPDEYSLCAAAAVADRNEGIEYLDTLPCAEFPDDSREQHACLDEYRRNEFAGITGPLRTLMKGMPQPASAASSTRR